MSDLGRAELRRLLAEATPGPWEFGDRQFRARVYPELFGEGRCTYCGNPDRPLVHTGRGKNPWHVHEVERPWWDHGIYAYRASGSLIVVNDTDEYGYMADEDARFIVAAVNSLPGLLDALEKAEAHRDSLAATLIGVQRERLGLEAAVERVRALHGLCRTCDPARDPHCDCCDEDWPCLTISALHGGE